MLALQQLNPYIRYCKIWPQPLQTKAPVTAYDCRIFYVLSGNGHFFINGQPFPFEADSLIFIPSGTDYRFSYSREEDVQFLILNFDLLSDHTHICQPMPPDLQANFKPELCIKSPPLPYFSFPFLVQRFEAGSQDLLTINRLYINASAYFSEIASGILKKILLQLISFQQTERSSAAEHTVSEVLAYIRRHYAEPITNQAIAEHFNFHPYYLNRIVKATTGQSLHQYLIHIRIQEAKSLLATSSFPIHIISANVGFGTAAQFSSTFKRITGKSPAKYRATHSLHI